MITIEHVNKRRGGRHILTDVSFVARPGRVTAFLGPNGAGKSSTLRILLGLDHADGGQALIGGRRYADLEVPLRIVGAALEGSGAHRSRTGRAHLRWVAASNAIPTPRIDAVLDEVGLADASRRRVATYSLGMGQRLGIATALLGEPAVLVLDEPTNGLDPEGIRWIRTLCRKYADDGRTVLLSSHLIGEVAGLADDVVVIHRGRIVATGPIGALSGGSAAGLEGAFFQLTAGPDAESEDDR